MLVKVEGNREKKDPKGDGLAQSMKPQPSVCRIRARLTTIGCFGDD